MNRITPVSLSDETPKKKDTYDKKKDRKGFIVAGVMVVAIGAVALFAVDRGDDSNDDKNTATSDSASTQIDNGASEASGWTFADEASCDFGTGLVGGSDDAPGYWDWLQSLPASSQSEIEKALSSCELSASDNGDDALLTVNGVATETKMSDIDFSGDRYISGEELPLAGWYYGVLGSTNDAGSYTYDTTDSQLIDVFNDRWS